MNIFAAIIGLVVLVLGGGYIAMQSTNGAQDEMVKEVMQKEEGTDVMQKEDAMMKDEMVKDEKMNTPETGGMIKNAETSGSAMEKDAMMKDEGAMEKGAVMAHGGTYEAYSPEKVAWAEAGDVVLFFRASWCPTCKAVHADIQSKASSIPKTLTILDVNYDTALDLKKKYGVTYQHTFVQVDAAGNQLKKWSGSSSLAALVSEVQ